MNKENIPDIVNLNQLCKLMRVSRSRFYQLLNDGFILPPIYSIESKRPFYTRDMAETNIAVIKNNVGVNGKVCLFYNTNRRAGIATPKSTRPKATKQKTRSEANSHGDLIEGLECLGLTDVKPIQIDAVLKKIYPNGIQNEEDGEVLKALYRAISEQNSQDNVHG